MVARDGYVLRLVGTGVALARFRRRPDMLRATASVGMTTLLAKDLSFPPSWVGLAVAMKLAMRTMTARITKHGATGSLGVPTLGTLWFLAIAATSTGGCATGGVREYQPLTQVSAASVALRWQALQALAEKEKWMVVSSDREDGTLEALLPSTDSEGIRNRIKITLLRTQTVLEVRSEIQLSGSWHTTPFCCPSYSYFRERLLASRLDGEQAFDVALGSQQPPTSLAHRR